MSLARAVICIAAFGSLAPAQVTLSITPATLSYTWQIGASLPAAQALTIKRSGSGAALDYTITIPGNESWLIVSPLTGKTGTNASVLVNPTSLPAGSYTAVLQISAIGVPTPVTVPIALLVKNPPPVMSAAPGSLIFTFTTDSAAPGAQTLAIATGGEPVSFTAAASGGSWLSIDRTTGIAMPGNPVAIAVSVNVGGLTPATYAGKITLTSANAANKSLVVNVTLTVNPGTGVISSIWPNAVPAGSDDVTITIRGQHLFKASVVKAAATQLTTTFISTNVLLAVVPKALLVTQGSQAITVTNAPQPVSNTVNLTVTAPGPLIQTVTNAASFVTASPPELSPGEIISIFGSGMGPAQVVTATPVGSAYPTTLGAPATVVEFELTPGVWTPAPILFAQSNQVNAIVPFAMTPAAGLRLRVSYNSLVSTPFTYNGFAANPGLFTIDASGTGQAAALNYNSQTATYSLNSEANQALRGSIVVLYMTGGGALNPAPAQEGTVVPTSGTPPGVAGQVAVTIGGDGASLLSATAVPGAVAGLVQLNVTVPATGQTGKKVPVIVSVAGRSSVSLTTIAVK